MTTLMEPRSCAQSEPRAPNRVALQITGRNYVSYTQLSLMRSCPRKFSYQYVENAPKDFIPSSLIYGGSIHAALEHHNRAQLEGTVTDAGDLLQAYHTAWQQNRQSDGDIPVKYGAKEDEAAIHALAERTLAAFLASPLAHPRGVVLGIEEELRITLHPDLPDVLAKVDLVTQTPHSLHVTDFKTARSMWNEQKALESSDQLVLYGVTTAGMSRYLGVPVQLHFGVLTKAKKPQVKLLTVPTDPSRVARMTDTALQTWSAIQAGQFYPNPSPMACSTCPFKSPCPVFAGK